MDVSNGLKYFLYPPRIISVTLLRLTGTIITIIVATIRSHFDSSLHCSRFRRALNCVFSFLSASSLDDNLCVVTSGHASPVPPCSPWLRQVVETCQVFAGWQKRRSVKLCMTLTQDSWQISSRRLTRLRSSAVLWQLTRPRYAAVQNVIGSFFGHLTHWATIAQIIII